MSRKIAIALLLCVAAGQPRSHAEGTPAEEWSIRPSPAFEITGDGSAVEWRAAEWLPLVPYEGERPQVETKLKLLYSGAGIYVLFWCEDERLTSTTMEDFAKLWQEDVVEVFLWPDESRSIYFEYELSPLNMELALLVPNFGGRQFGWRPWQYEGDRRVIHKTAAEGGSRESGAEVESWTAEFFVPFALLAPLIEGAPQGGDRWRGNFYRMDYDDGKRRWAWQKPRTNFHDYQRFGTLVFE